MLLIIDLCFYKKMSSTFLNVFIQIVKKTTEKVPFSSFLTKATTSHTHKDSSWITCIVFPPHSFEICPIMSNYPAAPQVYPPVGGGPPPQQQYHQVPNQPYPFNPPPYPHHNAPPPPQQYYENPPSRSPLHLLNANFLLSHPAVAVFSYPHLQTFFVSTDWDGASKPPNYGLAAPQEQSHYITPMPVYEYDEDEERVRCAKIGFVQQHQPSK